MKCDLCGSPVVDMKITYTLETEGKVILVENVPAKVCVQCGEKLFPAETVAHLQKIVWENKPPVRTINAPVYEYENTNL